MNFYRLENFETEDKKSCLLRAAEIDDELVRREQAFAEKQLFGLSEKKEIITEINRRTEFWLNAMSNFSDMAIATKKVRDEKRYKDPNAVFDYGSMKDRIAVGKSLKNKFWNNNLPNAVQCQQCK